MQSHIKIVSLKNTKRELKNVIKPGSILNKAKTNGIHAPIITEHITIKHKEREIAKAM